MATALIAVAAAAAGASISEALIEQLLSARIKIGFLIDAFDLDASQRLRRVQRELADQVAPVLASAAEPPDLRLVDTLTTRIAAAADVAQRDQLSRDRLGQLRELIRARIDELKKSPADKALLIKLLKSQSEKLQAELARNEGREAELDRALERILQELDELCGNASALAAKKRTRKP